MLLKQLPKADLHVHLDGSLRVSTVLDELKKNPQVASLMPPPPFPVQLPVSEWSEELLNTHIFKPHYTSLVDYLNGFAYTTGVMRTPEALRRVAYEFAKDCQADNVLYVEPRFAPQLHAGPDLSIRQVLQHVNQGLQDARDEYNRTKKKEDPDFQYNIIVCGMRAFDGNYSPYYKHFCELMPSTSTSQLTSQASLALVVEALAARDQDGVPVCALDIAGAEAGFPANSHAEAYQFAHSNFLNATVHAGEAYGPESIYQAITDLHAQRVGHGYHLYHPDTIKTPGMSDEEKKKYASDLINYMLNTGKTIEVCMTSNLQTLKSLQDKGLSQHSLSNMLRDGLEVTICTDNTLMSRTTVSKELELAVTHVAEMQDPHTLKKVIMNGFTKAFWSTRAALGPLDRRNFIASIDTYYDTVFEKFK